MGWLDAIKNRKKYLDEQIEEAEMGGKPAPKKKTKNGKAGKKTKKRKLGDF